MHRDQEADEAQRALRVELDDQPGGLGTVRVFDDMTEMLSDAGQDHLALEWCQAGVERAVEAGDDPEMEETYAGRIQREARSYEQSGATRVRLVSGGLADYEAYARAQQRDPAAPSTRRDYGEWCTKARPDRVRLWPLQRNEACWCDSGRKYKKWCEAPARN